MAYMNQISNKVRLIDSVLIWGYLCTIWALQGPNDPSARLRIKRPWHGSNIPRCAINLYIVLRTHVINLVITTAALVTWWREAFVNHTLFHNISETSRVVSSWWWHRQGWFYRPWIHHLSVVTWGFFWNAILTSTFNYLLIHVTFW